MSITVSPHIRLPIAMACFAAVILLSYFLRVTYGFNDRLSMSEMINLQFLTFFAAFFGLWIMAESQYNAGVLAGTSAFFVFLSINEGIYIFSLLICFIALQIIRHIKRAKPLPLDTTNLMQSRLIYGGALLSCIALLHILPEKGYFNNIYWLLYIYALMISLKFSYLFSNEKWMFKNCVLVSSVAFALFGYSKMFYAVYMKLFWSPLFWFFI